MSFSDSGKLIKFETWDDWSGVPPGFGYPGWIGTEHLSEQLTKQNLAGLPVNVITGDALQAAEYYSDNSLDLVFLDDYHDTEHVHQECVKWWPKIRLGGLMAGHDYDWPSVFAGVARWRTTGESVERGGAPVLRP